MNETNNHNNFEVFLRESIDDFKMIPQRKIWYGIYNNMHPDRKWPSISVCLLILVCILVLDVSNNDKINNSTQKNIIAKGSYENTLQKNQANNLDANNLNVSEYNIVKNEDNVDRSIDNISTKNILADNNKENINQFLENEYAKRNDIGLANEPVFSKSNENFKAEKNKDYTSINSSKTKNNQKLKIAKSESSKADEPINDKQNLVENTTSVSAKGLPLTNENATRLNKEDINEVKNNIMSNLQKVKIINNNDEAQNIIAFKEDYAFRNKPMPSKLKQNASFQYYLTPSIGYRNLTQTRVNKNSSSLPIISTTNPTNVAELNDVAALNIEFGAVLLYKVKENITAKIGVQTNYTNYTSKVLNTGHTTQANIAANNYIASNQRASNYMTNGTDDLNKTTWQIAVPIGADVKIIGNDKISWNIGATVQPTYIISGSAFVLSSDTKNYIAEKDLLRRFNINTAIETFVTLKTASGIHLSIGPQFRTQLFSTYKQQYNYSEKLYNLGLKIAVSTKF